MPLRLIREHEALAIRKDGKREPIKGLSIGDGFPLVYISDLIDFMNEREDLIKEFLEFVIDKREKEIEERIREFEKIKEFVREL